MVGSSQALRTALHRAEQRYISANPRSFERFERACAAMPGGNTRSVLYFSPFPVSIDSASGAILRDVDGHEYIDFLGEFSAGIYGHSHPAIISAATKALQSGIVLGGPNVYECELAALLCKRFPSCDLIRFCNSGTEANLMALVTACAVTGRKKVMVFEGGYHGGVLKFAPGGSPVNAPFDYVVAQYNDLDETRALIGKSSKELAAIILEPMLGGGGGIVADRNFLRMLREESTRHEIVLIFDEVMTSRLSPGGLQEKLGVRPDMTTFGKYIGGGFSFGAFGGRRALMEHYDPRRVSGFAHAGTFNNNVVSMAAGLGGLRDVLTTDTIVAFNKKGDWFREKLNRVISERQSCAQVLGSGTIMTIHFQRGPIRTARDVDPAPEKRALLHLEMLAKGFYIARRGYMSLSLALSDAHYENFIAAFDEFLEEHGHLLA